MILLCLCAYDTKASNAKIFSMAMNRNIFVYGVHQIWLLAVQKYFLNHPEAYKSGLSRAITQQQIFIQSPIQKFHSNQYSHNNGRINEIACAGCNHWPDGALNCIAHNGRQMLLQEQEWSTPARRLWHSAQFGCVHWRRGQVPQWRVCDWP